MSTNFLQVANSPSSLNPRCECHSCTQFRSQGSLQSQLGYPQQYVTGSPTSAELKEIKAMVQRILDIEETS